MKSRTRSLLVSLATATLDAVLFALCSLSLAGAGALALARWISGAIGAVTNFALNRSWAFRAPAGPGSLARQGGRYGLTAAVAVSLATALWWLVHKWTAWDPRLIHLLSMAVVWMGFTFPMMRGWVFGRAGQARMKP